MSARDDYPDLARNGAPDAEMSRLRAIVRDYGRHGEECAAGHDPRNRCRCGWREVEPTITPTEPA